jgi:hypothetical protein
MKPLERKLVELDVDIERTKRYKRKLKKKARVGAPLVRKSLKKTKTAVARSKKERKEVVTKLIENDDEKVAQHLRGACS